MSKRLAFLSLTLLTGFAVARCGSSSTMPPVATSNDDKDAGSTDAPVINSYDAADTHVPAVDSGLPGLTIDKASVDFGKVPCGTSAAAAHVTLTNPGGSPVTVSGNFTQGSNAFDFSIVPLGGTPADGGNGSLTIGPNATASLVISPRGVASSAGMVTFTDKLQLATDPVIPGLTQAALAIAVTESSKGAVLEFDPSAGLFQFVKVNTTKDIGIKLKNTGNDSAEVQFDQAGASTFSLSAAGPFTVAGATDNQVSVATFQPIDATVSSGTVTMKVNSGTLCSALPLPVFQMSGTGSTGTAIVDTTDIFFGASGDGKVPCGTQAGDKRISVTNAGNAAFTYKTTLNVGTGFYTLGNAAGTVGAGQTIYVDVQPNPIPRVSATDDDLYRGSVNITTDVPNDSAHIVSLHMTAQGAILTSTVGSTLGFGNIALGNTFAQSFSIINHGNQPANIAFLNGNKAFTVVADSTVVDKTPVNVTATFAPQNVQPYVDQMNLVLTSPVTLCAALPGVATLVGTGTPAPPLGLTLSSNTVDFGQQACGKNPNALTFAINNTGTTAFDWTTTPLKGLYTLSPSSGTISAASSQTVSVTFTGGVPFPGITQSGYYDDAITIQAKGGVSTAQANVALKLTAKGAIFNFQPSTIDFGSVPLTGPTASVPFSIVNTGNAPTEVDLDVTDGTGSASIIARTPLNSVTVGAGLSAGLTATFAAKDTNQQTATFHLKTTANPINALCQALPPDLSLSGTGTTGTALVSPSTISFGNAGLVDCGTQAGAQTVTISNSGNGAFNWTASLTTGGSFYTITPTSGSVPAAAGAGNPGIQTIQIIPKPIPSTSAVTTDLYAGTLTINDTGGGPSHVVGLHMTAHGAILGSTLAGQTLDFGNLAIGQHASQQFSVSNTGNATADLGFNDGTPAIFAIVSPSTVGPQQSVAPNVTFSPLAQQPYTDTAIMTVSASTTVLCAPLPANVTLKGTGVPIAPPVLQPSAASVTFGSVLCGAVGQPQSFSVTNGGTNAFSLTTSLRNGAGSLFSVAAPASIAPKTQQVVTLTMKAVPQTSSVAADFYGDVLTLTASTQGGTVSSDIPIHITAQGAILAFSPSAIDFGNVPQTATSSTPFKVVNTGNLAAEVNLAIGNGSGSTSVIARTPLGPVTVAANASQQLNATFASNDTNPQAATMAMSLTTNPANVLCQPLPGTMSLQGTGTNGTILVAPIPPFGVNQDGLVDCNTQAQSQQITISNAGNADVTFTAALTNGAANYQLGAATGVIPKAVGGVPGTTFLQVRPQKIQATSAVTPDLYAGAVTITTNAANDTAHVVQLHMTAHGAILSSPKAGQSIAFGSQTVNTTATSQFSVTNNGNAPASLAMTNGNAAFSFSPGGQFTVNGSQSVSVSALFLPTTATAYTDSAIFSVDASGPSCGAALGNVTLSGTGVAVTPPTLTLGVTNSQVSFGSVSCGAAGQAQTFTITNGGTTPFNVGFTFRNGAGSLFSAAALGGPVGAGAQRNATLTMQPIPTTASISPDFYSDVLTVTASNGGGAVSKDIAVKVNAQGAIMVLSPTKLDFGSVPTGATQKLPFTITNQGNLAAEVDMTLTNGSASASNFVRSPLGPQSVTASGGKAAMTASFDAVDTNAQSATVQLLDTHAPGNVFCSPMPPAMSLVGTGTSVSAAVQPGSLTFGTVIGDAGTTSGFTACGSQAPPLTVNITNLASSTITWTAQVTNGQSFYSISPTGVQNLAGNASATLSVIPNAIPHTSAVTPDLYAGAVTITTSAANDTPHIVQLHQTAQGVILTATTASLPFGGVAVNQTATQQFSITNNGNVAVSGVTLNNASSAFAVNPGDPSSPKAFSFNLGPTSNIVPVFSFTPSAAQAYADTATFTIPANVTLCGNVPSNIALSGSGTTGIGVAPSSVNFGQVQCPQAVVSDAGINQGPPQQAAPQQVTVTNQGAASQFKVTLGFGSSSPYTIQDKNGLALTQGTFYALPSGQTVLSVVPAPIQRPASTANDAFADSLTITTTSTGDSPHIVGLHQTAQGAVLAYAPVQVHNGDTIPNHVTYDDFTLTNSGNLPVQYTVYTESSQVVGPNSGFTINLPAPNSLQQLFAGQSQTGVLQTRSNYCPSNLSDGGIVACPGVTCTCSAPPFQLLGKLFLVPANGSILCSDPPPYMPLAEN